MTNKKSKELFKKAKQIIPGGVNSPVRAFKSVGGEPLFIKKASGSRIYDIDGNEYIDYVGSWGPMIVGHSNPKVVSALKKAIVNGTSYGAPNDIERVKDVLKKEGEKIACIILEPVIGNIGVVPPKKGFLHGLREVTKKYGIVLIFDEVMTGFRVAYGGTQELYNIKADLTCLGKIIGGGLPVGAYGGKREIMEMVAPAGPVYQAGTLSGNPLAM